MRIQKIELENFRQYGGTVVLNLSCDKKKNMNIIQGVNGAGKTNMMNAINWCLYGSEENLGKYAGKKQPIINDTLLSELPPGRSVEARVSVTMIDSHGRPYVFERKICGRKKQDGKYYVEPHSDFHAYQQKGEDMKESIIDKNFLVNRILPKGVKGFFFFDGERLDDFFKEENSTQIRDAILDVSQLSLIDRVIKHLEKTISSIRSGLRNKGTEEIEFITKEIEELERDRDDWRNKKQKLEPELLEIIKQISVIDQKLKMSSVPLVKHLQKERERLQQEVSKHLSLIEKLNIDCNEEIISKGPIIYSLKAIWATKKELEDKAKKGDLPPKVKKTFVQELLDAGECICGNKFVNDEKAKQKLMHLLNEVRISEVYEELTNLKYELNPLVRKATDFIKNQDNLRKQISDAVSELESLKTELRDISAKLEGINLDEISNLEIARSKLEQNKVQLKIDIGMLDEKIKRADRTIDRLDKDLQKELNKHKKLQTQKDKLKFADEAYELLLNVKKNLVNDIRKTIQQKTQDYFLSLIWKKDTYSKIKIDENYNLSVINKVGSECLGSLSAGERQVLALSFLAALREVSGFNAPIMIDTPLGRISKEPKENIAELLPEFLKESQVTMFMTDEEYTSTVREKLLKNVGKEFELNFLEQESFTMVIPYGSK